MEEKQKQKERIEWEFPSEKYRIFSPDIEARHKCLYGGRGGAKSWSAVMWAIIIADTYKCRILFTREVQISIDDSLYALTKDTIHKMGLESRFRILDNRIINRCTGSIMLFKGMQDVKSLEGVDIAIVEEAQQVSQKNATRLVPTIRTSGSQIWWIWNPENEDDWVQKTFLSPDGKVPPKTIIQKVNFTDNKFCSQELKDEANFLKEKDYEEYRHIWLGELKPTGKGWRFINPKWLEHARSGKVKPLDSPKLMSRHAIANDPAGEGEDDEVTTKGQGNKVLYIEALPYSDWNDIPPKIYNHVMYAGRFNCDVAVDCIGIGYGIGKILKTKPYNLSDCLHELNKKDKDWVPTAPPGTECPTIDSFDCYRSMAWWLFRCDLELGNIDLSELDQKEYEELVKEIKFHDMTNVKGKIRITPKAIIRKPENLGRSPGRADTVVAWNWVRKRVDDTPRIAQKPKNQHSRENFV